MGGQNVDSGGGQSWSRHYQHSSTVPEGRATVRMRQWCRRSSEDPK